MTPTDDQQTELLRLIWNEMKALGINLGARIDKLGGSLGGRIDQLDASLSGRIDQTNECLDETIARLDVIEGAVRDGAAQQVILGRYVRRLSERMRDDIVDLRARVTRLETERG